MFVIELLVNTIAFGKLYLKDPWNIVDIIVIFLSIGMVFLDLYVDNDSKISGILKFRGLFRIVRVVILIRKLNSVRVRNEVRKKKKISGYTLTSLND
jgi:hypothetical protein